VRNAKLYSGYRVDIGHKVGHFNECNNLNPIIYNDKNHCIRKTILDRDDLCQPRIYDIFYRVARKVIYVLMT